MKPVLHLFGALIALAGMVWFFQGIGVLPGSFMSGQTEWAFYGGLAILSGTALVALTFLQNRR